MRPVNLLPPAERRGSQAPARTGPLPYIVVGLLVALLGGVALLVTTSNKISESKSEAARLHREDAAATARAKRLAAYTQFRNLREQRVATVSSLADSRFDWERVMRELSLILPGDVWLTEMNASASAEAAGSGASAGGGAMRGAIPGPALEIIGCAVGQEGVAGFVTALKDIDGVTRVGVESSELPEKEAGAGVPEPGSEEAAEPNSSSTDCRTRPNISKFEIVVAFDAAPVPSAESGGEVSLPNATEDAQATSAQASEESSSEGTESSEEG
jgi:Tfp pilus assembly protein PilN